MRRAFVRFPCLSRLQFIDFVLCSVRSFNSIFPRFDSISLACFLLINRARSVTNCCHLTLMRVEKTRERVRVEQSLQTPLESITVKLFRRREWRGAERRKEASMKGLFIGQIHFGLLHSRLLSSSPRAVLLGSLFEQDIKLLVHFYISCNSF